MLPSEIPKLPSDLPVRVFPGVWKLLVFKDSLPGSDLCPYVFCLSFYLLYFFLPPFEDSGLPFWVPDIFYQHSEVVLWNLPRLKCSFHKVVGRKRSFHPIPSVVLRPPLRLELWILPPRQANFPFCFRPRLQMELDWMFIRLFVCFKIFPLAMIPATTPILSHGHFFIWIKCPTNLGTIRARTELLLKVFFSL